MLPSNRDDRIVTVHRSLEVDEDDLLDAVTGFALSQDLEIDHRHTGEGLLFTRKAQSTPDATHLFKRGDLLQVIITARGDTHDVEFVADLRGSARTRVEDQRGRMVRSGLLAALFAYLGVRGVLPPNDVGIVDFVMFGLSARFGIRASRLAGSGPELDQPARDVAAALHAVCEDAVYGGREA